MNLGLNKKNVLITGSTSGIGAATAKLLAEEGANVIVTGRKKEQAQSVANEIRSNYPVVAIGIESDLSQPGGAEKLYADAKNELGELDILVNSAGVWRCCR